jgi:hypothetical protein
MVGREVWGEVNSSSLKKHLKYCRENVCECLSAFMDRMNEGSSGLDKRFDRMMGPNAVQSGIPTHADQIAGRQSAMREAMDIYDDQGCGGPNAPEHSPVSEPALENMTRPIPSVEDWEAEHGLPMPEGDYQPGQSHMITDSGWGSREWFEAATGLTGALLTVYIIVSVGSRILYPPRNLVPVP